MDIISENREVLMCYFKFEPSQRGCRKRFHALQIEHHPESDISEQSLADQQKNIIRNNWFSETEIDEIKRHANGRNVTPERQGTEEETEANDGVYTCKSHQYELPNHLYTHHNNRPQNNNLRSSMMNKLI